MKDTFRQLTDKELQQLGIALKEPGFYSTHRQFVKKYYSEEAVLIEVFINSCYNDSTYDNSVQMIAVYDCYGNELTPNKATAKQCRIEMRDLPCSEGYAESSLEPMDDSIFIRVNAELPPLYVKE
jgi:hypothetical protein